MSASVERFGRDVPRGLRMLGCWGIERDRCYRFKWGEVSLRGIGFSLGYSVYHDTANVHFHLLWPSVFIKAPMLVTQRPGTEDWNARYGFSVFERTLHLNWRTATRIIHFPWDWKHVRHDVFDADGKRRPWIAEWHTPDGKVCDGRHTEQHPYSYILKSGEVQDRIAEVYGEEMEWRWRWFTWLPWPRKVRRTISVHFDGEVGERTGSWKGGCIGCGYEWRDGETMEQALRRMERERKF